MRSRLNFLVLGIALLAIFVFIQDKSHAALVARSEPYSETEWALFTISGQTFYSYRGPTGSFSGSLVLPRSSASPVGALAHPSTAAPTIESTELENMRGNRGRLGKGKSSSGMFKAVGMSASGTLTLNYSNLVNGSLIAPEMLDAGRSKFQGAYVEETVISSVPVPAGIWLFLSALVGLVGVVRYKHKRYFGNFQPE